MSLAALLLTIAGGLVPIGAALDTAFRSTAKQRLADWLNLAISRPTRPLSISSAVFDKIFGRRIWSLRAFAVSIGLALGGLIITLAATAIFSTYARDTIWDYLVKEQSAVGFVCLGVIVVVVILADYFSYTQTRLFIRATERVSGASTSIVFIIADLIASVAIFILGFSVARVLCMMIIAQFSLNAPVTYSEIFSPVLIEGAISREDIGSDVAHAVMTSDQPDIGLLAISMGFTAANAKERLPIIADLSLQSDLGLGEMTDTRFPYAEYSAELKCPRTIASFSMGDESALEVLAGSVTTFGYGAVHIKAYRDKMSDDAAAHIDRVALGIEHHMLERLRTGPSECPLPIVQVNQTINYRDALGGAAISDLYLSALLSTTWEVSQTIPYKMSTYQVMSLGGTYRNFLQNSYEIGSRTPFGLSRPDAAKLNMSEFLGRGRISDAPKVYVPMSSLATTSMLSSLVFLAAMLARLIMWGAGNLKRGLSAVFPLVELEKYPFSIVCGACAVTLLLLAVVSFVTTSVWKWVWLAAV